MRAACLGVIALCAARQNEVWEFKKELLLQLVQQVPDLLKSQDKKTGRFGTGVWIVNDQHPIYPLAAAWAIQSPDNPYHRSVEVLEAVMAGGDALIEAQNAKGKWVFRKKDGSTWGNDYICWTYSRWIRAFGLVKDGMPAERRARWEKALTLGYEGISRGEVSRIHNIPTHHAMGLYRAGQVLGRPEWCAKASELIKRVIGAQDKEGFWSEHYGPVVGYNFVYVDAIGTYCAMSGDRDAVPALERAARFHANFTYPDGSSVETVDERNHYRSGLNLGNVGFSFSAEGRGHLRLQLQRQKAKGGKVGADHAASLLLYGQEGPAAAAAGERLRHHFVLGKNDAVLHRDQPWFACITSYHCQVLQSRWQQDRQNFVSLFHDKTGLIVGGGNTKLQPQWSTFTVGDVSLMAHKTGDESPNFLPRPGLAHVPTSADLDPDTLSLSLAYGGTKSGVRVELVDAGKARLTYRVESVSELPIEAHVTLLPRLGKPWETASGKGGTLGKEPLRLSAEEAGAWFGHAGWRVSVPEGASVVWPALPHNPYKKDGAADVDEGRIVLVLRFSAKLLEHRISLDVP